MANEKVISSKALIELFQQALKEEWGYIWGTAGETWTAAKQASIEKTTDADRAQARKYGSKWIGHKVSDCSGLFSWAFKKLGGYMYHGSHTMYLKYCTAKGELKKGKRTDGQTLKPGTAVFVWNATKQRYSHVGLFIGNGLVIEAASTTSGVITSKVTATKWSHWGELKGVSFDEEAAVTNPDNNDSKEETKPVLKRGSKGQYVTALQTMLKNRGYDLGSYGIDGDFGKSTEAAVKQFQRDNHLAVDGIVGPSTWEALEKNAEKPKYYTVHIPNLSATQANQVCGLYAGSWISEE